MQPLTPWIFRLSKDPARTYVACLWTNEINVAIAAFDVQCDLKQRLQKQPTGSNYRPTAAKTPKATTMKGKRKMSRPENISAERCEKKKTTENSEKRTYASRLHSNRIVSNQTKWVWKSNRIEWAGIESKGKRYYLLTNCETI